MVAGGGGGGVQGGGNLAGILFGSSVVGQLYWFTIRVIVAVIVDALL